MLPERCVVINPEPFPPDPRRDRVFVGCPGIVPKARKLKPCEDCGVVPGKRHSPDCPKAFV